MTNQISDLKKEVADQNAADLMKEVMDLRKENKDFKEEIINLLTNLGQSERPREERKEEAKQE